MESEEHLDTSVVVGAWTFTPVVTVGCTCQQLGGLLYARGDKRVVAIEVRHGEQHWRLEIPGDGGAQFIPAPK